MAPCGDSGASTPPHIDSPYDHEQPAAGHVYAVIEPLTQPSPQGRGEGEGLPDDWSGRVRDTGAIAFNATPDRKTTLDNLQAALQGAENRAVVGQPSRLCKDKESPASEHNRDGCPTTLWSLSSEQVVPFFAIGFGLLIVDGLFEAMEHQNVVPHNELWQDVQEAVRALPDDTLCLRHLQAAAEKLSNPARDALSGYHQSC